MSIKLISKAWECPVSGNDLLILLALCDFANDDGELYPSLKTIQTKTKTGKSTLCYILNAYEAIGVLQREKRVRNNGSDTSTLYKILTLDFTLKDYKEAYQNARNYTPHVHNVDTLNENCGHPLNCHIVDTPFEIVDTLNENCGHLEPSYINHQDINHHITSSLHSEVISKNELDSYLENWNLFAKQYRLSIIQTLTNSRVIKLKARIKEHHDFFSIFETACKKISLSDFLLGKKQRWKATFDWLINNDKNILKVIEGNYDNEKNNVVSAYVAMRQQGLTLKDMEQMQ